MPPTSEPPSSPDTADLAQDLRLTIGRLARRIRKEQTSGLTPSQHSALSSIGDLAPVRMADLAAAEHVAPPTLSKTVSVLEEEGLVTRSVDDLDRRAALLGLTPAGEEVLVRARIERTAFLRRRLDSLTQADRDALRRAMPALEAIMEGPA